MAYATATQVIDRIGEPQCLYLVDRDNTGTLSAAEQAYITAECEEASRYIDGHLDPKLNLPLTGTNLTNSWLTDATIWLVMRQLYLRKSGEAPATLEAKYAELRECLEKHRLGMFSIPGITYPGEGFTEERRHLGTPVVGNPGGQILGRERRRW